MVKAKIAIVIVILALLEVSWVTAQKLDNRGGAAQMFDNRGGAGQMLNNRGGSAQMLDNCGGAAQMLDNRGGGVWCLGDANDVWSVMTVNGFQKGEDGGGAASCDGRLHSDDDLIVALSSGWYVGGKRCRKKICITSKDTKRTVEAIVVDECDFRHGCKNNVMVSSPAVWKKLGLGTDAGEVHVTWSDA